LSGLRDALTQKGYEQILLEIRPFSHLTPEREERFLSLARELPASLHLLDVEA
jgi:hypothetical protein